MADEKSRNEVDRWRQMLDEAERELEEKAQQWQDQEYVLCGAINRLSHQVDENTVGADNIRAIRESIKGNVDIPALKKAMDVLSKLDDGEPDRVSSATSELAYGQEVRQLLERVSLPKNQASTLKRLVNQLDAVGDAEHLEEVLDAIAAYWETLAVPKSDNANTRVCALLVSEVMVQLLERLSLPAELSERLTNLRKGMERGVEDGGWNHVLAEIADMAADIRSKINQERVETELFLKGVTERLDDVGGVLDGSQESMRRFVQHGNDLNAAMNKEMQGLRETAKSSDDIGKLKNEINHRLENITQHVGNFLQEQKNTQLDAEQEVEVLRERLQSMEKETTQLHERIQKERQQSMTDALTGIPNRLAYDERMVEELARWKRFQQPICLAVWDVDFFKKINDGYGHVAGDNALKSIAKIISGKIRETDFIARFGGEEFVLIMPGADIKAAQQVVENLRKAVASAGFHFRSKPVKITISCGLTSFRDGDNPHSVFERADKALYEAKSQGRNRVITT